MRLLYNFVTNTCYIVHNLKTLVNNYLQKKYISLFWLYLFSAHLIWKVGWPFSNRNKNTGENYIECVSLSLLEQSLFSHASSRTFSLFKTGIAYVRVLIEFMVFIIIMMILGMCFTSNKMIERNKYAEICMHQIKRSKAIVTFLPLCFKSKRQHTVTGIIV